jgi:hypothetical protein
MTRRIICAVLGARKWRLRFLLSLCWLLLGSHLLSAFAFECPKSSCNSHAEDASSGNPDSHFAFGDFDGDRHPDLATVEIIQVSSFHTRYWVSFQLSTGRLQTIGVTAPSGGLALLPRDVNGDSALDLVVVTAWRHKLVAVLLNDGAGNFAAADSTKFSINVIPSSARLGTAPSRRMEDRAALAAPYSFSESLAGRRLPPPTPRLRPFFSGFLDVATTSFQAPFLGRPPPLSVLHS